MNYLKLIFSLIIPLTVGSVAGIATSNNVDGWYTTLQKPIFNPPNYLFGPVWIILYILMGISLFIVWQLPPNDQRKKAIGLFFTQLLLNFCWSFIFFQFHFLGWALVEIILLFISILLMTAYFKKLSSALFYLQLPYIAWVLFASILNASIWWLNM